MKALVYTGPKSLEYREVEDAVAGSGEHLIRIDSVGICGSDMHAYLGHDERRPAPLILGHEAAGVIVSGDQAGRRVTINPLVSCGHCDACISGRENLCPERKIISMPPKEGAFAQYVAMRDENLVTVPDDVSFEKAALAEPIACGWHAVRLALRNPVKPADQHKALVLGGGAIGVGAALSLKAFGVGDITVVEPNALRCERLVDGVGLDAVHPDAHPADHLYDVVVDAVGYAATREEASRRAVPGGVIVHIGLGEASGGLDIRRMTLQEITFIGTYTYTMADFRETAEAIFDGRLGALDWMETRDLADGADAFADLLAGRSQAPKIILKPQHS